MPFERPLLPDLIRRIQTDIEGSLAGADARLRRSVEDVLARALAGGAHQMHGFLQWLAKQLFPDTAEREYVLRHGSEFLMTLKPADFAAGPVDITGSNGSISPANTLWQRSDGAQYKQAADATIVGGVATIAVTAVVAGVGGNVDDGVKLRLVAPVAGIASEGEVATGGITDGVDEETLAQFVTRLAARKGAQPQGGGPGDYVNWALEVPGVTKAWEIPNWTGLGRVGVTFLVGDGEIPDGAKVEEVRAYVQAKAPVLSLVVAFAPAALTITHNITIIPNTIAVQDAVTAQLEEFYRNESDRASTVYLSRLNAAISAATGLSHHTLTLPVANVTAAANQFPKLGSVVFA